MQRYESRSGISRSGVIRSAVHRRPLAIRVGGVDLVCQLIDPVGFTITKSLSGGLSECVCAVAPTAPVQEGHELIFTLGGDPLWGGTILPMDLTLVDATPMYWQIAAVDWRWLLDRWRRVTGTYAAMGVNAIAAAILRDFTDPASGFQPGYLPDDLGMVETITFLDTPVSEAITRLAQAARKAEGAFWRIRPTKAIDIAIAFPEPDLILDDTTCLEQLRITRSIAQIRTETWVIGGGARTAAVVPTGATTIPVTDGTRYAPTGGFLRAAGMDLSYTGVVGHTLTGVTGVTSDLPINVDVLPVGRASDAAAQAALAARLGGGQSGRAVFVRENTALSYAEATGAALADLDAFKAPMATLAYGLTTPAARLVDVGKFLQASRMWPVPIAGTFRVQELAITSITAGALVQHGRAVSAPRLRWTLEARASRRPTWFEFVRQA